ncbi:hypothetical protein CROQUDRAFT_104875 [Cronartium quercuum f. sp. fusiforme G11]|uniref:Uncharacterized protein n=1 Tax=Cronartium quercuum f. sp. fusiforme G11 TaxID=708437 RepID=A0A9P6NT33_9BASI|nr:hypothetical protein CROQUDRAFT_104875 [Cronartium quercuum f. sp. fusiforme G11]
MGTVLIRFPSSQPPNLFPHPGFLTGTKYGRPKDPNMATPDQLSSVELSPADHTDSDEPSSAQSSLASPIASVTNTHELNSGSGLSGTPRPRAVFRGSTSTFITSSEGLPLANSVLKTLYSEVGKPDERALGFYTWNKSLFWTHLGRPMELARLNFQACPISVTVNPLTTSAGAMDVIPGHHTEGSLENTPFEIHSTSLHYDKISLGENIFKIFDRIFLEAPVGYVRKAPEEIRSQFLIRSFLGSRPSREVLKTSAEAFDSQISAGDFGELLRRL